MRLTGLEPATQGLGIPCSIRTELQAHFTLRYFYELISYQAISFDGFIVFDGDVESLV